MLMGQENRAGQITPSVIPPPEQAVQMYRDNVGRLIYCMTLLHLEMIHWPITMRKSVSEKHPLEPDTQAMKIYFTNLSME